MAAPLERTREKGIYRRGGRYVVVFRDAQGRQRKRAAPTLQAARRLRNQLLADVSRGEFRAQSRVPFDDYARTWIETYTGRTRTPIRPNTREDYRQDLENEAIPFFGRRRLAEISPQDIKAFAHALSERGLAASTVRNLIAPVRALFATAFEDGLIRVNPCAGERNAVPTTKAGPAAEDRPALPDEELGRLLEALPEEWRLMVRFLAQTGLRVSELIALRWEHVDLGQRRVHIRERIYKNTVDAPKSKFGIRTLPISQELAQDLWNHHKASRFNRKTDPVFPNGAGNPHNSANLLRRVIKPAAERAGVPWAGLHTLRHTCASMLFRSGWNAKQVQTFLGHHSPAFTLATYVHLIPDDLPEPDFPAGARVGEGTAADALGRPTRGGRREAR